MLVRPSIAALGAGTDLGREAFGPRGTRTTPSPTTSPAPLPGLLPLSAFGGRRRSRDPRSLGHRDLSLLPADARSLSTARRQYLQRARPPVRLRSPWTSTRCASASRQISLRLGHHEEHEFTEVQDRHCAKPCLPLRMPRSTTWPPARTRTERMEEMADLPAEELYRCSGGRRIADRTPRLHVVSTTTVGEQRCSTAARSSTARPARPASGGLKQRM